jgi:hypothetical protein
MKIRKMAMGGVWGLLAVGLLAGCYNSSTLKGDGSEGDSQTADPAGEVEARPDMPPDERPDIQDVMPDSPLEPDDPTVPDSVPDSACAEPSSWSLQPRRIQSVSTVGPHRMGATERLQVEVQLLSGCEILGQINVGIMQGDVIDLIVLAAFAWVPSAVACTPDAPIAMRMVVIPGREQGSLTAVVSDVHNPDGDELVRYGRVLCSGSPECQCRSGSPPGPGIEWSDCLTDCSCAEGLSCIGYSSLRGPDWSCLRPCSDFFDCYTGEVCITNVDDGPEYVCSGLGDQCENDTHCPEGFRCAISEHGNFCDDQRVFPSMQPCTCDADCPVGQLCTSTPMAENTLCQIPCLTSGQCPNPDADVLVCGTDAVCVPLED